MQRQQRSSALEHGRREEAWAARPWHAVMAAVALTAAVHARAIGNGFLNWDDTMYLLTNPAVQRIDLQFLRWAFTTHHTGNWIPLTWVSHAVDWWLFGPDPRGHHLTSVLLHAANAGLMVWLSLLTLRAAEQDHASPPADDGLRLAAAALSGILFGLHPLRVESVSWVSERKDVLSGAFFLLSLATYLRYGMSRERPLRLLSIAWLAFVLGYLSKAMVMTLPVVLLILDFWPLRRMREERWRLVVEKLPFFIVTVALAWVAFRSQDASGAVSGVETRPLGFRVLHAFRAVFFYGAKWLLPTRLSPFYPLVLSADFERHASHWVPPGLAVVATILTVRAAFLGRPAWLVAWAYWGITLAPVLGLIQIGSHAYADRYTYLPSLGVGLLAAGGWCGLTRRLASRSKRLMAVPIAGAVVVVAGFGVLTTRLIDVWHDSVHLWERVVDLYPDVSPLPHANLANAYLAEDRRDDALREARRALALRPTLAVAQNVAGSVALAQGDVAEARAAFERALHSEPTNPRLWINLAGAQRAAGQTAEAEASLRRATEVAPADPVAWFKLASELEANGDVTGAIAALNRVAELDPRVADDVRERTARLGRP